LRKDRTLKPFATSDWEEVTLDIDEQVNPDIVEKLPDLSRVESDSFDAVYSSHCIEHLYPHEVPTAFMAFHRVLKSDGIVVVRCPDLQSLGERLASGDIDTPLYVSPAGPVSPLDMLYGFRPAMRNGNLFMAHRSGFTSRSLERVCAEAGFKAAASSRSKSRELWGIATKTPMSREEAQELANVYFAPI
jgi:SAM-dependent methyltransferase